MDDKITLDKKSFMALASESRIELLKKLDERRMTLSELARELQMSKPAVLKHLEKLIEAGLVKKNEDERKWIYYSLTLKGKNILHPERVKIVLLLSTSFISLMASIGMLWKYLHEKTYKAVELAGQNEWTYDAGRNASYNISYVATHNTNFFNISLYLSILAAILIATAIFIYSKKKMA
jgi:DNA-binding transcriptional ArsR family regulator